MFFFESDGAVHFYYKNGVNSYNDSESTTN